MEKWEKVFPKILLACAVIAFFPAGAAVGQVVAQGNATPAAEDDNGPGNFAAPDRNVLQSLNHAQKVLKEGHYGEALEGLSQILRSNEDYFFQPDRKAPIYKSLKAEARQLLGQMPREGRDLYEVRSGGEARDKLNRAVAAGDDKALSEISAQLFHTQAGYEATWLLALYHMDHGAPLAGALTLKRLREAGAAAEPFEPGLSLTQAACYYQAGMLGDCRQILVELKRRTSKPALQIGGRDVPWFEKDNDAPAWLARLTGLQRMAAASENDRWAMFRGDPARNASTTGSPPLLNLRWRVEVSDDPSLQKSLAELETQNRERGVAVFPGLHPLAIGDVVLMRTATNVLAIDFKTGKRLWPTTAEEEPSDARPNGFNRPFISRSNMPQQAQYAQRIWDDATYGTLSSDGSLVYVIEQLPLGVTAPNGGFVIVGRGGIDPSNSSITNRLAAYDIRTGKKQWDLGSQDALLSMPDTFFLGAPLPLRGQLYVMAEVKDEIRLLALDAATGSQIWSQQLAMVESNISQDPIRRLAGVSPSYSDGVLVCPTGSGCTVAVDLATHSLLWGYIYGHPGEQQQQFGGRRFRINPMQNAFNNNNGASVPRWLDGTATIVDGRVLITPAEADALYCLDLADGKPAWPAQPRGENYYIACVHDGLIVLVGRNSINAIQLADGSKAWGGRTISVPAGVCGHGCFAGNQYFVPLCSGEVMAFDVETGRVISTAKSRRSAVPGNLVCYRGHVISQGMDGVELYYQVDAAREEVAHLLAANPDNVEGLTLRGEMLLDAGKSTEAVADFRRAYSLDKKSDSHGRTRELLRDALQAGLRDNFAAHRSMAGELEQLLDNPTQWAAYFRSMAVGLQQSREWRPAVEYLMKLADLEEAKSPSEKLEKVAASHLVRRDCWVQAHLGTLRSEGGTAAAAEIDRIVDKRLDAAKLESGCDGLIGFLALFGNQPQAAAARAELRERLTQAGRIMEAEMLVASAVDPADRKAQASLLADMVSLNMQAGRVSDAAACFRQLRRDYPEVPCHGGMTGEQWLAVYPKADALRKEVNFQAPPWKTGEVTAAAPDANDNSFPHGPHYETPFEGPRGPYFTDYNVNLEVNQQVVSLRDGLGQQLPNPMRLLENSRMGGLYNASPGVARSCGHLLLISMGAKIFALDPWKAADKVSQTLWTKDLTEPASEGAGINVVLQINNGFERESRPNPFGPVNARYASFQRRRDIVAVDPITGDPLWVRQDIPPQSEVFGDEQYLFVLSPGSDEASVYRAIDGQLLGTRHIPRPKSDDPSDFGERAGNSTLASSGYEYFGRYVLTWKQGDDNNDRILTLFDPWQQKAVWPARTFASGSCVSVIENEAVGVMEPLGHFVLTALGDGHTIADLNLPARQHFPVTDLVVRRFGDQYIVLAHDSRMFGNVTEDQGMQPPQGMATYAVRRSRIYALDLQGKPAWPAPADVDHAQFLLNQPGRLPVLVFASFHDEYRPRSATNTVRGSVVAVDRRSGRIVYDNRDLRGQMRGMAKFIDIRGDPAENVVRIAANNQTVNLTFTDKPIKTTLRHSTGLNKPRGKLGEALLDAVENAVGMPQ
jgi:outer membrane protein assembly factor BamB